MLLRHACYLPASNLPPSLPTLPIYYIYPSRHLSIFPQHFTHYTAHPLPPDTHTHDILLLSVYFVIHYFYFYLAFAFLCALCILPLFFTHVFPFCVVLALLHML